MTMLPIYMAGQYNGLQARIKAINKKAEYVPGGGHSLNLKGLKALECCFAVVAYFLFVKNPYLFFQLLRIDGIFY